MKRAITLQQELSEIAMVEQLTGVFEGIASLKIAKIRNRVVESKAFFAELWQTYRGLRINPKERLTRMGHARTGEVYVAVTAEGKLSGSIDEQVIEALLEKHHADADIVVMGSHGAAQLRHHGITPLKVFPLPASDVNFSVSDIIVLLGRYQHIKVFYQTYESLRLQKVASIELLSAVRALSEDVTEEGVEVVSSRDFIFEPNLNEIIDYMESVMMEVALIQIIMESKLAQYANRFNAMNAAKERAGTLTGDYQRLYNRAKRAEGDERLKELMKVVNYGHNRAN